MTLLLISWTPTPPQRSRHLVKHGIIRLDALQNAEKEWIWNHLRNLHCMLHSASDVADDLEWVERMSDPLLLNNNHLVDRSGNIVLKNGSRVDDKRIGYTVEPFNVPIWMHPLIVLRDRLTAPLLAKDMESKLQEGSSHLCWVKRPNRRRRSGNGLNIVVLPRNQHQQVTHHLLFVGHDPSGVPTYALKRRQVSSVLVRSPDDMTMLHRIHQASKVCSISKPPGRFPSTHIRPIVIFIFLPRNDMFEVS